MDITLIGIGLFLLVALVFLSVFLLKSTKKKSFMAEDGSVFESQSDLDVYQSLYDKTKLLFLDDEEKSSSKLILGFQRSFLSKIKTDGFSDLKTLVKYRKQIKSLSDLINI